MDARDNLDLGGTIDLLYSLRAARLEAEKKIKEMKSDELALKVQILRMLEATGLDGAKGKAATAAVVYEELPVVKDWDELWDYVEATDSRDLLQRRISVTAIRDRWNAGKIIPGIDKFNSTDLSLTKRSAK